MEIKKLAVIVAVAAFTSGCQMYGDTQIKPHHHSTVHKVVVKKVYPAPKTGVPHSHPANGYTKVVNHSHPGGGKAHRHNYGKAPQKKPTPPVVVVKVVSGHGHHHHGKHHTAH